MNGSYLTFVLVIWFAFQLAFALISIWIGVIVFRQRTQASWIVLIGAILWPLLSLGTWLVSMFWSRLQWGSTSGGGLDVTLVIQAIGLGGSLFQLLFLGGILLHLLRRSSESDRIAELEAIIRDRDMER